MLPIILLGRQTHDIYNSVGGVVFSTLPSSLGQHNIGLREQLLYILDQHNMNMKLNLGTFDEVDTV
jgi:hypothetical protein